MCVYSMIGDWAKDTLPQRYPWIVPMPTTVPPEISRDEFEALKRDMEDLKNLLQRAKKYDEENDHKDCETDEKVELLRKVAKLVGVDLGDIHPKSKNV